MISKFKLMQSAIHQEIINTIIKNADLNLDPTSKPKFNISVQAVANSKVIAPFQIQILFNFDQLTNAGYIRT